MSFKNAAIKCANTNPAEYHKEQAERGSPEFVMSCSGLKAFGHCPSRWVNGYKNPDTKSKKWGNMLDCYVLTPGQWAKRYQPIPATYTTTGMECPTCHTITDSQKCRNCKTDRKPITYEKPWDWKSTTCQAWAEEHKDVELYSVEEAKALDDAKRRLFGNETISNFITSCHRQVWITAEWHDPNGIVVPIKAMLDMVPDKDSEFCHSLGDLKTTRSASEYAWLWDCYKMGFYVQAALYCAMYAAATNEFRNKFCFVVQENYAPWEPARRFLSQEFMEMGVIEYTRLLHNYAACLKSKTWPSYDDNANAVQGWGIISPTKRMMEEVMAGNRYDFEPQESEEPTEATR